MFETTFNRSIKLRQADPRITSDAGALFLREVDHRLGLTADLAAGLYDPRDPAYTRYTQTELLRQHLYGLALGYAHQDDQDTLAQDVGMKLAVWDRPGKQVLKERPASQPSDWRLVDRLSSKAHRRALNEALPVWIGRHQLAADGGRKVVHGTLDIDPFPIEVHGRQQGGAYHGHYCKTMYYPMVASFSAEGSYESYRLGEGFIHAILRRGNAAGAEGMARFTRETIRKGRALAMHLDARIDAGLVEGKVLDVIDLPDFKTGMRDLFPRSFFLVTNWRLEQKDSWALLEHYHNRGTFEDRLGEFNAVIGNGLSAESFAANEASPLAHSIRPDYALLGLPRLLTPLPCGPIMPTSGS